MGVVVCSFILGALTGIVGAVAFAEWMDRVEERELLRPKIEGECNHYTPGTKEK